MNLTEGPEFYENNEDTVESFDKINQKLRENEIVKILLISVGKRK